MEQSDLDAIGMDLARYCETHLEGSRYIIILASPGESPLTSIVSKLEPGLAAKIMRGIAESMETGNVSSYVQELRVDPQHEKQ